MFKLFKKDDNDDFDIANVSNDNVNKFIKAGHLKFVYLISPNFGGSEGVDNRILVTPKAYKEKELIDNELFHFLEQGKSVNKFNIDLKYKGNSIVPSKIIVSAIIDEKEYNKIVEVW